MLAPLVTVAMSVHNGAATLHSAIQSLLWQTFSDWELLVVNDASTDASLDACLQFQDSRIRVIDEPQQRGLAARINQCVDLARGKYVARMDSDDIAYPDRFERQVGYLDSHPDIDLLGHGAMLFKGEGEIIGLYPMAERHEEICRRPWWGFPLAHPTWMGKREWFLRHRYDENIRKGQDQELLLRTFKTSQFASLKECLLGYRMERVSWSKSIIGRTRYCQTLLSQVHNIQSAEWFVRGVMIHGVCLLRDVALGTLDFSGKKIRQSLSAPNPEDIDQWYAVLKQLRECAIVGGM